MSSILEGLGNDILEVLYIFFAIKMSSTGLMNPGSENVFKGAFAFLIITFRGKCNHKKCLCPGRHGSMVKVWACAAEAHCFDLDTPLDPPPSIRALVGGSQSLT